MWAFEYLTDTVRIENRSMAYVVIFQSQIQSKVKRWRVTSPGLSPSRSHINLCSFDDFVLLSKIVIEGIRGTNYAGDIALDDFLLGDSPCPPEGL